MSSKYFSRLSIVFCPQQFFIFSSLKVLALAARRYAFYQKQIISLNFYCLFVTVFHFDFFSLCLKLLLKMNKVSFHLHKQTNKIAKLDRYWRKNCIYWLLIILMVYYTIILQSKTQPCRSRWLKCNGNKGRKELFFKLYITKSQIILTTREQLGQVATSSPQINSAWKQGINALNFSIYICQQHSSYKIVL